MTGIRDLREMLKDPKRSQRGSVLSGVLIIVAFLTIIIGALMTELSTNLLLSRALVHRVSTEATVNSAMELALDRFQNSPLGAGCPALSPVTVNGSTASVSYLSCAPVVDSRSPQFRQIASASSFAVDGSRNILPGAGVDLYIVGDSGGNVFQFPFGGSSPNWSQNLPGGVSGPPLVMLPDASSAQDISNLVPLSVPSNQPAGCDTDYCVALLTEDIGSPPPDPPCYMPADGPVTAEPAAGIRNPDVAFFGDRSGSLFAYNATEANACHQEATSPGSASEAIVAGPLVFAGPVSGSSKTDELYVVVSSSSSSRLEHYTYTEKSGSSPSLAEVSSVGLPSGNATGIAVDGTTVPATVAVTFLDGHVAMVQIQSGFGLQLLSTTYLATGIADAPFWCHCPGSAQVIGVGGTNGSLFLLDTALNTKATFGGSGASITTTPRSDMAGDWFFGAADGYVHEVQQPGSSTSMVQTATFGPIGGPIASSIQVGPCGAWICIYGATQDGTAFIVSLDARDALLTACISSSPTSCSGANPRLWTRVEVGSAGSPQTVHVQGWSYYSP